MQFFLRVEHNKIDTQIIKNKTPKNIDMLGTTVALKIDLHAVFLDYFFFLLTSSDKTMMELWLVTLVTLELKKSLQEARTEQWARKLLFSTTTVTSHRMSRCLWSFRHSSTWALCTADWKVNTEERAKRKRSLKKNQNWSLLWYAGDDGWCPTVDVQWTGRQQDWRC